MALRRPASAILWLLITAFVMSALAVSGLAQDDKVVPFSEDDPEMNAAIAKARGSLDLFWEKFAHPASNEGGFSLKTALSEGSDTEHFWCSEIEGNAQKASCAIANGSANGFER